MEVLVLVAASQLRLNYDSDSRIAILFLYLNTMLGNVQYTMHTHINQYTTKVDSSCYGDEHVWQMS